MDEIRQHSIQKPHITSSARSSKRVYRKGEVVLLGKARVGVVKYVGPVRELNEELMFGVEIRMTEGELGQCDGTIDGHRYFKCAPDCGIFVRDQEIRRKISSHELLEKVVTLTKKCSSLRRLVKGSNSSIQRRDDHSSGHGSSQGGRPQTTRPTLQHPDSRRNRSRSHDVDLSATLHTRSYSTPVSFPWEEKLEPEFPDDAAKMNVKPISMWSCAKVLQWLYTFAPRNSTTYRKTSSSQTTHHVPSFDNFESPSRERPLPVSDDNLVDEWQEILDIFEEHNINGRELLELDVTKLNAMGIADARICWKILHEIDKLCDASQPKDTKAMKENDDSKMFSRMREFFRSLDDDGDGCIRISDWRTIVHENAPFRFQQILTEQMIHRVFDEFNITQSGALSEDEFVIALGVFYFHRKKKRSAGGTFRQSTLQKDSPKIVFLYALKHILRKLCGSLSTRASLQQNGSPGQSPQHGPLQYEFGGPMLEQTAQTNGAMPSPKFLPDTDQFRYEQSQLDRHVERYIPRDDSGVGTKSRTSSRALSGNTFLTRSLPLSYESSSDGSRVPLTRHISEPQAGRLLGRKHPDPSHVKANTVHEISMVINERPSNGFRIPAQPSNVHTRVSSTGSIKTGTV